MISSPVGPYLITPITPKGDCQAQCLPSTNTDPMGKPEVERFRQRD